MTKPKKRKRNSPSDVPDRRRARAKKHYDAKLASPPCSICGEGLRRGGLSAQLGFHRKCDPSAYMAEHRRRLAQAKQ